MDGGREGAGGGARDMGPAHTHQATPGGMQVRYSTGMHGLSWAAHVDEMHASYVTQVEVEVGLADGGVCL